MQRLELGGLRLIVSRLSFLGVLLLMGACATQLESAIVSTELGVVRGENRDGLAIFRGIPYAAAPVGDLRWRAPQPHAPWSDTLDTVEFGAACIQPALPHRPLPITSKSEDCLTLNIWTESSSDTPRPVMVWIHGGAFFMGASSLPYYDGEAFARSGVTFVSINYRLGYFGFFAHPALNEDDDENALANFGLADQVAALEWVQNNIKKFGGDPNNITVFGESAGGKSITHLLTSKKAKGLFHKAIVESGGGYDTGKHARRTLGAVQSMADDNLAWAAGRGFENDAAALRATPADVILGELQRGVKLPGPVIDGNLLTENVAASLTAGDHIVVPLLIGANSFEASLLKLFRITPNAILGQLGGDRDRVNALYEVEARNLSDELLAYELYGDGGFVAPARFIARKMALAGAPARIYYFDHLSRARRGKTPGAPHGSEIPYAFKTLDKIPRAQLIYDQDDYAMSEKLHDAWVAFANSGDPGSDILDWPVVNANGVAPFMVFTNEGVRVDAEFRSDRLDFHDDRFERREYILKRGAGPANEAN